LENNLREAMVVITIVSVIYSCFITAKHFHYVKLLSDAKKSIGDILNLIDERKSYYTRGHDLETYSGMMSLMDYYKYEDYDKYESEFEEYRVLMAKAKNVEHQMNNSLPITTFLVSALIFN